MSQFCDIIKIYYFCLDMIIKTKSRIIESAIEVFNANYSAPLQKVADNANITRRTLHRYFKDRNELVAVCEREMEISCKKAMINAIDSSNEPLVQLKNMLIAGINCGSKYSFFYKLHKGESHNHNKNNKDCADYDYIYQNFTQIIRDLQEQNIISRQMTIGWIQNLHAGIIISSVSSDLNNKETKLQIKEFAWKSFIKGISP
ncbi:TetR family transcriptional regulator [uncultured Aquimarina sp.]|uniref:TetR/AcrR family transcriptional regulator n=1 Tax=uncultured Aquimarina sp. TaxID=575652 RepID=UPI00263566CC|nr:TetR family transcriptional regulator [uncultured Aquimarina sp.]